MLPLELAEILEQPNAWLSIEEKTAACLRKQHETILKLREVLALVLDDLPDYVYSLEPVLDALEATKEYDNNHT